MPEQINSTHVACVWRRAREIRLDARNRRENTKVNLLYQRNDKRVHFVMVDLKLKKLCESDNRTLVVFFPLVVSNSPRHVTVVVSLNFPHIQRVLNSANCKH